MYKLNEKKMFFDLTDGQAIIINFETGIYYGTTSLGSVIWNIYLVVLVRKIY